MIRLTFLGTSAAQPTLARGLSGLAVRREGELLLFDCGEGSQRQMMRFGTGFSVAAIFFTHFHADHYLGLLGFLRTLNMQGREEAMDLFGPVPARTLLDKAIHLGFEGPSFPLRVHELHAGDRVERAGYRIEALQADHGLPALGYALVEADRPGEFSLDRAQALGIPEGPLYGRLQHGERVDLGGGRVIDPQQVLGPPRSGRRIVVSGDTRPCKAIAEAARGSDLLVHEATFAESDRERALATRHSTAQEAATLAREAGVRRLILTHFSSRYEDDLSAVGREARAVWPGAELAHDGLTVEIPIG